MISAAIYDPDETRTGMWLSGADEGFAWALHHA